MAKCDRTNCTTDEIATYSFQLEGYADEYDWLNYCTACVALCVQQGFFSPYEVHSLHMIDKKGNPR